MPITLAQFYTHLTKQPLKPVYLIASDVTLLLQEARDKLRKVALEAGFQQREKYFFDKGFSWDSFYSSTQNYGLFSEKTFIELENPNAKFDEKILKLYLENPPPDKVLVILCNKLTSSQTKARWHKVIEQHGISLQIRAITRSELPEWIKHRAKAYQINLSQNALQLLVELTEGNLTATQQALYKLKLLYPNARIDSNEVIEVISNNARYNVFDLSNFLLAGETTEALRCLHGLKNTGTEATLVLWSISREIRSCLSLRFQYEHGANLDGLLQKEWATRRTRLKQALQRLSAATLEKLLSKAFSCDLFIKGQQVGNPWVALESLCLNFCDPKSAITEITA